MKAPLVVITGAGGFVGPHVAKVATEGGWRVWATGKESEPAAKLEPWCEEYIGADLARRWPVSTRVDAIVHLAGLAAVGPSFADPQRYIEVNSAIMTTMCESLLQSSSRPRVVVVSSGSVYAPDEHGPIEESAPTLPSSPYSVAKLLVETQARYYAQRGLDTVIARPFNHIGPGQGAGFLVPDLVASLRALPPGAALPVGNLDTARDYTDVRDVARAYHYLASSPSHASSVYNVASGQSRTGHEVLAAAAAAMGRDVPTLVVEASRLRPGDAARIRGSADRLRDEFGWAPQVDWKASIRDFVHDTDRART